MELSCKGGSSKRRYQTGTNEGGSGGFVMIAGIGGERRQQDADCFRREYREWQELGQGKREKILASSVRYTKD